MELNPNLRRNRVLSLCKSHWVLASCNSWKFKLVRLVLPDFHNGVSGVSGVHSFHVSISHLNYYIPFLCFSFKFTKYSIFVELLLFKMGRFFFPSIDKQHEISQIILILFPHCICFVSHLSNYLPFFMMFYFPLPHFFV